MKFLRQNTATTVSEGPFLDPDGVTAETALTITPAQRKLSKAGAALAATSDGSNATHDADGDYRFTLTATDLNTVGPLRLRINASGALPYVADYHVLTAQAYDAQVIHPLIAQAIQYGTAQGGGSSSITLATAASSVDDYYNGCMIDIYDGTGAGQSRYMLDYVGSSRGAVTDRPWTTTPDATSKYIVRPGPLLSTLAEVGAALGARVIDGTLTQDQSMRLQNSALFGKLSGAAGTSIAIRNVGDTKDRIAATVDSSGNRSAVTLDGT